jgi:hypothetical protein
MSTLTLSTSNSESEREVEVSKNMEKHRTLRELTTPSKNQHHYALNCQILM